MTFPFRIQIQHTVAFSSKKDSTYRSLFIKKSSRFRLLFVIGLIYLSQTFGLEISVNKAIKVTIHHRIDVA